MCLAAEDFLDLCELYPATKESLLEQGILKRQMFFKCLQRQFRERTEEDKQVLTSVIYKDSMKSHSKYQECNEADQIHSENELQNLSLD